MCKITELHKRRPRPDMGWSAIYEEEEVTTSITPFHFWRIQYAKR
jgi:hypothetical protein